MRGIRRVSFVAAAMAVSALLVVPTPAAAVELTEAQVRVATAPALAPVAPNISNRPSMLVETDSYVYGPGTGFDVPQVTLTIENPSYDQPATLYAFWENRVSGARQYFNLHDGFSSQPRDVFGATSTPAKIFVPSLDELRLWGPDSAFGAPPAAVANAATGAYQFVVEVRDGDGNAIVARSNAMYNVVDGVQVIPGGDINGGNWTRNNAYLLAGPVYVANGVLNIEPGTFVLGDKGGQGTLIVLPEGRLNANGNAMLPIVFTSAQDVGTRTPGDWGGLVLSGNAPVNGGTREGEGDSGQFGGNDPNHNCGTLRYVRVEFAGIRFSEQNELNGIALQGCGKGTTIERVQVHYNLDDGIEFFGGTNDAKYVLITAAQDDSFDWTFGWNGRLQFGCAVQGGGAADNGIEADNDGDNPGLEPRSNPTLFNMTFVGAKGTGAQANDEGGIFLRRGTGATVRNTVIVNFADPGIVVDGDASNDLIGTLINFSHTYLFNNTGQPAPNLLTYLQGQPRVQFADPRLSNPGGITPDLAPRGGSPARGAGSAVAPPADGFFSGVNFAGCVDPNNPWIWEGWTTFADN